MNDNKDVCAFSMNEFEAHKKDLLLYYLYLSWIGIDKEIVFDDNKKPKLQVSLKPERTTFAAAEYLAGICKLDRRTIEKYIKTYGKNFIIDGAFTYFIDNNSLVLIIKSLLKTRTYADANNIFRVFVFLYMKCITFGEYQATYERIEKESHIQQGVFPRL